MNEKLITYKQVKDWLNKHLSEMKQFMDQWEIRWFNQALHFIDGSIDMLEFTFSIKDITK